MVSIKMSINASLMFFLSAVAQVTQNVIIFILIMCAYNVIRTFQRLTYIKKDVMLTNPCFYVFGDAFRVLHLYCTHFEAIFSFNKIFFYQQTFNTILKLTGAYNMSLKATKSKQQYVNDKN